MAGLFDSIAGGLPVGLERKAVTFTDQLIAAMLGNGQAKSGVSVSPKSAMRVSTVLSCCRVIGEGIAQIPLKVYRDRSDGGKEVAKDLKIHRVVSRRPNAWMTSFEFRETLTMHAVLTGSGYAFKVENSRGELLELLPIAPQNRRTRQLEDYGLVVDLADDKGVIGTFPADRFLRINGPSWDAVAGLDMVAEAREAIGLALATEENHSRLFSNGARPGGILSVEGTLTEPARARLKAAWEQARSGLGNAFRTAVLPANIKWVPMAMKGVDAEHLDTRKFQIEEICRSLKVFPQMVGYADKTATFASAEAFFQAHVIYTLLPWTRRWEEAIDRDLIDVGSGATAPALDVYPKFSVQGLMRGDAKTRAEFYASGIINGWMVRNEARRLEDLDPLPGLDEPLVPLNMGTQAERDALAKAVSDTAKAALIGHNGGPALDDVAAERLEDSIAGLLTAFAARPAPHQLSGATP